jgi:uncharacterized membrane protein
MWFLGLIVGLMLGSLYNSTLATLLGIAGILIGLYYKHPAKAIREKRIEALELRVYHLESMLAELKYAPPLTAVIPITPDTPVTPMPEKVAKTAIPPSAMPVYTAPLRPKPASYKAPPPYVAPEPSLPGRILNWLLTGENAIARIGMLFLLIGIGFMVKYAADHAMFPIELRLASAVLLAIALLVVGWRMRIRYADYATILQGGGVGVLYLTTYGAYHIWHLIPATLALSLMTCIAIFSTLLAIWQDARPLAIFGVTGGFLAPLLAAGDSGNHVALFTYYTILNLGIFATAWYKSWRVLNLLGFVFTFTIALFWGANNYRPELFASTEPFLLLFFLMYVGIALLYARTPNLADMKKYIDAGLIFGVPVAVFGLQAALVHGFEFYLAYSSLILGIFYISLSRFLQLRHQDEQLVLAFLALGVIFTTLAIPLAFDAQYTAAVWAVEGAGIFWFGGRQNRRMAWRFGLLLQVGAAIAYLISGAPLPESPINHMLTGALLLSLSGLVSYNATRRETASAELTAWAAPLFFWGLLWWLFAGLNDISLYAPYAYRLTQSLLFISITVFISDKLALRWPYAEWPVRAFTAVLWLFAVMSIDNGGHPFAHYGVFAWVFALAIHYRLLYQRQDRERFTQQHVFHIWSYLLLVLLGAWELSWLAGYYELPEWQVASLVVIPVFLLIIITRTQFYHHWPLNQHLDAYLQKGGFPVVAGLWLWTFYANLCCDGSSTPLPYLPLLNPIDIAQGLIILSLALWLRQIRSTPLYKRLHVLRTGGAALFVWLNAILLRTLHHWAGVAWHFDSLMHSMLVQTSLSLFWTLLALVLMVAASRRQTRSLWLTGAALMGVVLVKLLLIDLAQSGTLERIISFIGVGFLMLLIGYFAPYPGVHDKKANNETHHER